MENVDRKSSRTGGCGKQAAMLQKENSKWAVNRTHNGKFRKQDFCRKNVKTVENHIYILNICLPNTLSNMGKEYIICKEQLFFDLEEPTEDLQEK